MTYGEIMRCYLERLGHGDTPRPSWENLCDLVTRHQCTVPFENLDIVAGLRNELDRRTVLNKVAIRRRGGFCYELNEAFGALLEYLGFQVHRIEARVWSIDKNQFGAPFDHLALVVKLADGDYLTDVGFGDNHRTPLRLPVDAITDLTGRCSLRPIDDGLSLLSRGEQPLYCMSLQPQPLSAFVAMHRYHQESADSSFAQGLICTRATVGGRITLSRNRLIIATAAERTETLCTDVQAALVQYFGLEEKHESSERRAR